MAKDPICGKEVDQLRARAVAIVDGHVHYFCSAEHKAEFMKDPANRAAVVETAPAEKPMLTPPRGTLPHAAGRGGPAGAEIVSPPPPAVRVDEEDRREERHVAPPPPEPVVRSPPQRPDPPSVEISYEHAAAGDDEDEESADAPSAPPPQRRGTTTFVIVLTIAMAAMAGILLFLRH